MPTNVPLDPLQVLRTIPGWEHASVQELSGGLTYRTYRVDAGGRLGILKLDDMPRRAPLNTRSDEAYVQNFAADAGLAAKPIQFDSGFYLSEYLDGTVWQRDSLNKKGNLEKLAKALRRLHDLPLTGRPFDASFAARTYIEKNTVLDSNTVARCQAIISNTSLPQDLRCCHNDLVVENMVATPDLMFLDWEYACDNDPLFDLASVIEHHRLSDIQATDMLNSYLDGDSGADRPVLSSLNKQRQLYLALLCLWLAARPDTDRVELQQVVQRLITRNF